MGRPRKDYDGDKLAQLKESVLDMQGVCKPLADDLLEAYVRVYRDYLALDETLRREGLLVETERGGANNRHVERVKHPAFDMRRNCVAQMADLANKIKRFVKDDPGTDADEFTEF